MACMYVDCQLLLQTILYFTIVITGLVTAISSGLAKGDFDGQCILYGHATGGYNGSSTSYDITSGPASICSFITGSSIFVCIFYALPNGCYHAYAVHRSRVIIRVASQMWLRTLVFGTILALLVTLVAACSLTVGKMTWCDSLRTTPPPMSTVVPSPTTTLLKTTTPASTTTTTVAPTTPTLTSAELLSSPEMSTLSTVVVTTTNMTSPTKNTSLSQRKREAQASYLLSDVTTAAPIEQSCVNSQDPIWKWYHDGQLVNAGKYFYNYSTAESSCWASFVFWLIQLLFYIRRLIKSCNQHQQNTYQDPFNTEDAFDVFT